jgi:hypothetical protein
MKQITTNIPGMCIMRIILLSLRFSILCLVASTATFAQGVPIVFHNRFTALNSSYETDVDNIYFYLTDWTNSVTTMHEFGNVLWFTDQNLYTFRPEWHKYLHNSVNYRFLYWRDYDFLADVNHQQMRPYGYAEYTAQFNETPAQFLAVGIDGIPIEATLTFRDPWKVEYQANNVAVMNDTFQPYAISTQGYDLNDFSGFGGVHKDKSRAYTSPYYRIRASGALHWDGADWVHQDPSTTLSVGDAIFAGWKANNTSLVQTYNLFHGGDYLAGYDTKDIVFKGEGGLTTATYKAHLLSGTAVGNTTSSGPTGVNSQRKIDVHHNATTSITTYHAVYESNGEVWYMKSADDGANWSDELRLSDGNGVSSHPSIHVADSIPYIVWKEGPDLRAGKVINCVYYAFDFGVFDEPIENAAPVIAHNPGDDITFIAWETGSPVELRYVLLKAGVQEIEGTIPPYTSGSSCKRPSISHFQGGQCFDLVWIEGGGNLISTSVFVDPVLQPLAPDFRDWAYLDAPSGSAFVGAPSLTLYHTAASPNNCYNAVACEVFDDFGTNNAVVLAVKYPNTNTWSAIQWLWSSPDVHVWAPSLSAIDRSPCGSLLDNLRCSFNISDPVTNEHHVDVVDLSCGNWDQNTLASDAVHPSVVSYPPDGLGRSLYTNLGVSSNPTPLDASLKEIISTDAYMNKTRALALTRAREVVFAADTDLVQYGLGPVTITENGTTRHVAWNAAVDTFVIGRSISIEDAIRTEPFSFGADADIAFDRREGRRGNRSLPGGFQLRIQVVNARNGQVLATLHQSQASQFTGRNRTIRHSHALRSLAGTEVYLRMSASNIPQDMSVQAIDYYNLDASSTEAFPKGAAPVVDTRALPTELAITSCSPNPFTDATEISYSLSAPGSLKMTVHNMLGQRVATVVEACLEAGRHTATFDARGMQSGTYLITLETDGAVVSKKVTLAR